MNEAVNEVLLDEEDFEGLRQSIDEFDNFDQLELAQKLERHELLEMRRIAALLFKRNKRWDQSISLSKVGVTRCRAPSRPSVSCALSPAAWTGLLRFTWIVWLCV